MEVGQAKKITVFLRLDANQLIATLEHYPHNCELQIK